MLTTSLNGVSESKNGNDEDAKSDHDDADLRSLLPETDQNSDEILISNKNRSKKANKISPSRDRTCRMDVHYKQILRMFRNHFVSELKLTTNYIARKYRKGKSYYHTCV